MNSHSPSSLSKVRRWAFPGRYFEPVNLEVGGDEEGLISGRSSNEGDLREKSKSDYAKPTSWRRRILFTTILLIVILLGVLAVAKLHSDSLRGDIPGAPLPQAQGGTVVTAHCGTNPQEAQARGCLWDIMSFGWVHPSCWDPAESARMEAKYGPWEWYTDKPFNITDQVPDVTGQVPLKMEELPFEPIVWTTHGYHVQHCLYILKMLHLGGMSGGSVSNEGIELAHTDHCVGLISDPAVTPYQKINTKVNLLFVQCVTLT
ncbi:hypothetical protein BGZ60DRAFT_534953 [Tricladium varicosporioides]|nr:hypothetical protein BGZ60DRAFT_534953 [Hymenoscyphus varicosporioides]